MSLKIKPTFDTNEVEIIAAFYQKQEQLIESMEKNFHQHVDEHITQSWNQLCSDYGEIQEQRIEIVAGLTNEEYDLQELFTKVMPLYHRSSVLMSLWGAFENELTSAFNHFSKSNNGPEKLPNKPRGKSSIWHLIDQISKLVHIPTTEESFKSSFGFLDEQARHVRNTWAHEHGRISGLKIDYEKLGLSESYGQLVLTKAFIQRVIMSMYEIGTVINSKVN